VRKSLWQTLALDFFIKPVGFASITLGALLLAVRCRPRAFILWKSLEKFVLPLFS
jgi:hypothetical protein